jgi:predicted small secreted protein
MHPRLAPLLIAASLVLSGCSTVRDEAPDLPQQAGSVADQAQFCFAVTRALQGVAGGSVGKDVVDAAEEVLAQAPDDLRDHARTVAEAVRDSLEEGTVRLRDEAVTDASEQLREGVRTMCEPRDETTGATP